MSPTRFLQLIIFIGFFLTIGGIIGFATSPDKTDFYETIIKSTLTPPGWVFGVVWPTLYCMIAISAWLLWEKRGQPGYMVALRLFILQMVLNWGWSFVFFTLNLKFLSFLWILTLVVVVAFLIAVTRRLSPMSAVLLVPYFLWISFASYLSGTIWWLN